MDQLTEIFAMLVAVAPSSEERVVSEGSSTSTTHKGSDADDND